jgi:hypothetical protein
MPPSLPTERNAASLTADEEVTLRRVAYGQSEVRTMRAQDLAQLHRLLLIEDAKDGPRLTAAGRKRFDALPKASAQRDQRSFADLLAQMTRMLDEARR